MGKLKQNKFYDLVFGDFENFPGCNEVIDALRKVYDDKVKEARAELDLLWGDGGRKFKEQRVKRIRELYDALTEADFRRRTHDDNVGQFILCGVTLAKVLKAIKHMQNLIDKNQENLTKGNVDER